MLDFIRSITNFSTQPKVTTETRSSNEVTARSAEHVPPTSMTAGIVAEVHTQIVIPDNTQVLLDRRRTERLFVYPTSNRDVESYLAQRSMPIHAKSVAAIRNENYKISVGKIREELFKEMTNRFNEKQQNKIIREKLFAELLNHANEKLQSVNRHREQPETSDILEAENIALSDDPSLAVSPAPSTVEGIFQLE